MKSKSVRILRIPSLLLAAALQLLPIIRMAVPAAETTTSVLAIIFRWGIGAAAILGGVHAVSGASTVITNPLSTNIVQGQLFTLRLTTGPNQAHYWTASGLPAGLALVGTNGQTLWKINGTSTVSGTYNVGLTAKDQQNSGAGLTTSATLILNIAPGTVLPPAITTQPASQTVIQNQSVNFSVIASGAVPLTYQWRFKNTNLTGQTNPTLVINPVTTNNAGNYDAVVSNNAGSVTSMVATLTVNLPSATPIITTQPSSQTATQGQNVTFMVAATGTAPLSYFWRKGTAAVAGPTGSSFSITNVQPADAGSYSVIVSNPAGTVTSSSATLTINPVQPQQSPFIIASPTNQTALAGATISFAVAAGGAVPLHYQWYFNNSPLAGQINSSLTLTGIRSANAGGYFAVVTNLVGAATSVVATLTMILPPRITIPPKSQTNMIGTTATFGVTAASVAAVTYQWQKAGMNLTDNGHFNGTRSNFLQIIGVQTNDASDYSVVVTNIAGAITSQAAVLTTTIFSPLVVQVSGAGTVSPNYNGQTLIIGKNYTMTAKPTAGYVFSNWVGGLVASKPALVFAMQPSLTLQANFIPNPFPLARGIYNGLFYEKTGVSHLSSGSFTATTTDSGHYSGALMLIGHKYSISGQFSVAGFATNYVLRGNLNPLTVELELDLSGGDQIRGRVTDGYWSAPLLADRVIFAKITNPAPQAGTYTLLIPGAPTASGNPPGDGFGTVTVDAAGRLRFSGQLADGSKVTQNTTISKSGEWPLYVPLYSGAGSILSWLTFTNGVNDDLDGLLSWNKLQQPSTRYYPGGFAFETDAAGSKYLPPLVGSPLLNFSNGQVWLTDGNLAQSFTNQIMLGTNNKIINLSSNKLTLTFTLSSGLFKGSVVNPATGKSIPFSGAVLQKQNLGCGCFLGTNQCGKVYFGP